MTTSNNRGSALLMALFVLILLTGMGTALLFLSRNEARMGQSSLELKKAFYLAEAGVEDGRVTLFLANGEDTFDDDLTAAAGANGIPEFDPDAVRVVHDPSGAVTGLQGIGDDVPIRALTQLTGEDTGWYAAFLTNDPVDGPDEKNDSNRRVTVTGVGAGPSKSVEVVQAILRPYRYLPSVPAAAVTLLGPLPSYDNGNSNSQSHIGNDCGVPGGPFAPIVGTVNGSANAQVQADMNRPDTFESGPTFVGQNTIGDLTNPLDPIVAAANHGTLDSFWTDCEALRALMLELKLNAHYYCDNDGGGCTLPATSPGDVVFIDGDLSGTPPSTYTGILAITGKLTYNGNTGWDGIILAVGEGSILRTGGGNNNPSGAVVVANIDPTPDGPSADWGDWCTSTPEFGQAQYQTSGAGNSVVEWCSNSISSANSVRKYRVTEFLQR